MSNYVDFIKLRRKAQGFTQKDMGKRLNMSPRKYQLIEEGHIKLEELIDIAKVLGFEIQLIPKEAIIFRG
jgi:transcriptional regulator with XRE-family HTH domain